LQLAKSITSNTKKVSFIDLIRKNCLVARKGFIQSAVLIQLQGRVTAAPFDTCCASCALLRMLGCLDFR
jgi:hypothetical protein